jgi:hypothetical protein
VTDAAAGDRPVAGGLVQEDAAEAALRQPEHHSPGTATFGPAVLSTGGALVAAVNQAEGRLGSRHRPSS